LSGIFSELRFFLDRYKPKAKQNLQIIEIFRKSQKISNVPFLSVRSEKLSSCDVLAGLAY
jgi:hypothetical protein